MDVIEIASTLTLYGLLTAAVIGDLRSGKVSNRLILMGLAAAFLLRFSEGGILRALGIIPNVLFPVILLFLFFVCGALGAGDIKLFSMIGGFISMHRLIGCIVLSFTVGAVWSLGLLLMQKRLFSSLKRAAAYGFSLLKGEWRAYEQPDPKSRICFTVAIWMGTALSSLWWLS